MESTQKSKLLEDKHISVLLNELVDSIKINKNKKNIIVDCTLGIGGHAEKIIQKLNKGDTFIGFDADIQNLELSKQRLEKYQKKSGVKIHFIHANFIHLKTELKKIGIEKITGVYYDLGISSLHVDEAHRGFSFQKDGPLDMRFDKSSGKTAAHILNSYTQSQLRHIFITYGEEPSSNKIAANIIEKRKKEKFKTTKDLRNIIEKTTKSKKANNRIFQAVRIEVNKELESLEKSLQDSIKLLEQDGYIFVISFHSLEDRITKQIFKRETKDCICTNLICDCKHTKTLEILTKKPILPSKQEKTTNQRSRSAKARIAKKISH